MANELFWWIGVAVSVSVALLILGFAIGISGLWLVEGIKNDWRYWNAVRQIRRWDKAVKRRKKGGST